MSIDSFVQCKCEIFSCGLKYSVCKIAYIAENAAHRAGDLRACKVAEFVCNKHTNRQHYRYLFSVSNSAYCLLLYHD